MMVKFIFCKTCDGSLKRGNMPVQAKANGLDLPVIPNELCDLNTLELRLLSLRVPFMKMVALPSGKQRCIHGPAVNVPSKVDNICTLLPRSQTEVIPLKLKRKLRYKRHYMYDYVTPDKVIKALVWLKANNQLYSNVDINDSWVDQSLLDNREMFSHLVDLHLSDNSSVTNHMYDDVLNINNNSDCL